MAMKVYDLGCEHGHRFEGWFGSAQDYASQQARGLLQCPLCGSRAVQRLPSAARLNLSHATARAEAAHVAQARAGAEAAAHAANGRSPAAASRPADSTRPGSDAERPGAAAASHRVATGATGSARPGERPGQAASPEAQALQAAWLRLARQVIAATEDVGERFVEEARRIHYDEAPARPIRGVATPRQAAELAEEGIEAVMLPLPHAAKEPLQ